MDVRRGLTETMETVICNIVLLPVDRDREIWQWLDFNRLIWLDICLNEILFYAIIPILIFDLVNGN